MAIAIGIDVHKKTSTFFAYGEDGEPLEEFNKRFKRVPSNRDGYTEVLVWLGNTDCDFLMENSTKTHDVYWILQGLGYKNLYVAHSVDLKRITKSSKKTDQFDAEKLATYMRVKQQNIDQFRTCYICTPEDMRIRRLCRIAKQELFDMGRIRRRIRSHLLLTGREWMGGLNTKWECEALMNEDDPGLRHLGRQLNECRLRRDAAEEAVVEAIKGNEKMFPIYEKLKEIPNFGDITAAYLAAVIVDIDRFENPKKLAAYLGIVPRMRDSGETENHCGLTRSGDPAARWLLIQATFRLVNSSAPDSQLKAFFAEKNGGSIEERKEADTSGLLKRPALVATANKLIHIIFALLTHPDRHW